MYREIKADILIIGTGAAGLRAAISAYDSGARDIIALGKCKWGDAHTILATGGINAALGTMDPKDSWMLHAADTIIDGGSIADFRYVNLMCRDAPRAVMELVKWGARFHKEPDGRVTQRFFGAATYRRACFYGDQTGKEMMRVLMAQVRKRRIRTMEDVFIVSMIASGKRVAGALAIDFFKGEIILFRAKAVVLAAGGYTKVYTRSSSRSYENQGDGAALALELGVGLVDMEMVQFHPTGMIYPKQAQGILVTEAVRGEGGLLFNAKGERFMGRYYPEKMELGPRDVVARAIYMEIKKGNGTKHGGVWLDITSMPKAKILERLPKMYRQFKEYAHVDISKQRMEVAPTAHYTMGGVDVSIKGETSIKGLYAVGETVGQVHGANRLGGNSLLETVVFGRIVGREAAALAKRQDFVEIDRKRALEEIAKVDRFFGKGGKPEDIRDEVRRAMWDHAGIARDRKTLAAGLRKIEKLERRFRAVRVRPGLKGNSDLKIAIETARMFGLCKAIMQSALMRTESRGAHYRTDYPKRDDRKWMANIVAKRSADGIKLGVRKVPTVTGPVAYYIKHRPKVEVKLLE
ncbi:MAG: FAD-binding protein [Candidatus Micrarchaeota archaeon]|nr:FAD-binding protein [Candidatus Micrarchaeota archaeon]